MIADVREKMAAAIETIPGLRCSPYLRDTVNPPEAMIDYEVNYDLTFGRGADEYLFVVIVFVQRTSERAAQILLDQLREPSGVTSVKTVLEADTALDAVVDYVRVRSGSRPAVVTVGATEYLAVEFPVEVVV